MTPSPHRDARKRTVQGIVPPEEWRTRIEVGIKARRGVAKVWGDAEEWDKNKLPWDSLGIDDEKGYHDNRFQAIKRAKLSTIVQFDPQARVTARRMEANESAPIMQELLQSTISRVGLRRKVRRATNSAFTAFGVIKVNYDAMPLAIRELEQEKSKLDEFVRGTEIARRRAISEGMDTQPFDSVLGRLAIEQSKFARKADRLHALFFKRNPGHRWDRVTADYLNYKNLILDPLAESPEECEWMAERHTFFLDELKENRSLWKPGVTRGLQGTARKVIVDDYAAIGSDVNVDLQGTTQVTERARTRAGSSAEELAEQVETMVDVWEIWDRRSRRVYWYVDEQDGIYIREPQPWPLPEIEPEFPYKVLFLGLTDHALYQLPNFAYYEPLLRSNMELKTRLLQDARNSGRVVFMPIGVMKEGERDAFKEGRDIIVEYEAKAGSPDLKSKILDFQTQRLRGDIDKLLAVDAQIIREMSGVNEYQTGGAPANVSTATEASAILNFASAQVLFDIQLIDEWVTTIISAMGRILEHRTPADEPIRVSGSAGAKFITIRDAGFVREGYLYEAEPQGMGTNAQAQTIKGIADLFIIMREDPELGQMVNKRELLRDMLALLFPNVSVTRMKYLKDPGAQFLPAEIERMMFMSGAVLPVFFEEGEPVVDSFRHHQQTIAEIQKGVSEGNLDQSATRFIDLLVQRLELLIPVLQQLGFLDETQASELGQRLRGQGESPAQVAQSSERGGQPGPPSFSGMTRDRSGAGRNGGGR